MDHISRSPLTCQRVLKEIHLDFTYPSHTDVLDASRNDVQLFGEKTFILRYDAIQYLIEARHSTSLSGRPSDPIVIQAVDE